MNRPNGASLGRRRLTRATATALRLFGLNNTELHLDGMAVFGSVGSRYEKLVDNVAFTILYACAGRFQKVNLFPSFRTKNLNCSNFRFNTLILIRELK